MSVYLLFLLSSFLQRIIFCHVELNFEEISMSTDISFTVSLTISISLFVYLTISFFLTISVSLALSISSLSHSLSFPKNSIHQ